MIYRLFPTMSNTYEALSQNDMPPTLYSLMESKVNYGNDNPVKIEDLPENFRSYLFDFDYPLDNIYKENFENMFLTHYMFRRIGFETYLSFKLHLKVKLNNIMPKYNKMLEGFSQLNFNGFVETHERVTKDVTNGTTETDLISDTTTDNRQSNTPQNQLSEVQSGEYVDNYSYNQNNNKSNNKTKANANTNTNENITIKRSDEIDEYKKFIDYVNNIYSDIFKECDSLFYGLV